jgi:hypothetical protein
MSDAWRTADLSSRPKIPLTACEREAIHRGYQNGLKLAAIAAEVGRKLPTVKNVVRELRANGLVGRRYLGCANA